MACTRRKVHLSSRQYVDELQATKEERFVKFRAVIQTPTHGYAERRREDAMAAFAKSWRRLF
jgi:hypothetical protein